MTLWVRVDPNAVRDFVSMSTGGFMKKRGNCLSFGVNYRGCHLHYMGGTQLKYRV